MPGHPATAGVRLSRRTLLKLCAAAAALLGVPPSLGPVMAAMVVERRRRPLIWLSFQECTGCTEFEALDRDGNEAVNLLKCYHARTDPVRGVRGVTPFAA